MKNITPIALSITLACSTFAYAQQGYRQHDAHVHGQVELNIAQDGQALLMEITAPGADVLGFEHSVRTDKQRHQLAAAVTKLKQATIFSLNQAAACTLEYQDVSHSFADEHEHHNNHGHEHHNDHDHEQHNNHAHERHNNHQHERHNEHEHEHGHHNNHDHERHNNHDHEQHNNHAHDRHNDHQHRDHGEFSVQYQFTCADISQLSHIETQWFSHFPATKVLKVNLLTDSKQTALELTKGESKIALQ